ncbi:adhesion G protein-coupled receptor A3 isoform X1 [Tachysurus ichikawai]
MTNAVAVASIHLPLAGSVRASALRSVDNSTCRLQLVVFRNGKLFPCTGNSSSLADDGKRRSVATPVAFVKLDGCSLDSFIQPVIITLRHLALGADPTAAYWDFDLLDGHGGWRAEGCHITGSAGNTTTVHCTQHKNFAVLMVRRCISPFCPCAGYKCQAKFQIEAAVQKKIGALRGSVFRLPRAQRGALIGCSRAAPPRNNAAVREQQQL